MTFPFFTTQTLPGFCAVPSGLHPLFGSSVSPLVLKSVSPSWRTSRSSSIPSIMFGVSIEISTGAENMRCFPGIPNSKIMGEIFGVSSLPHFLCFFVFSVIFLIAFSRMIGVTSDMLIVLGLIVPDFFSRTVVPSLRVVFRIFFSKPLIFFRI